eukprot:1586085-Alexandrium_andersonii.AAC.1
MCCPLGCVRTPASAPAYSCCARWPGSLPAKLQGRCTCVGSALLRMPCIKTSLRRALRTMPRAHHPAPLVRVLR